jgi:hexosaminidase
MKLNHSGVDAFMATLLDDLLPRTSPYTSLYHVGGDEVNMAAYLLDETVKSNSPALLQPLLQRFIDRVVAKSIQFGLQPIVWEEMLLDWNLTLPSARDRKSRMSTLVQVWRSSERIEEVLKRGHRAIFGDYHYWYLDCKLFNLAIVLNAYSRRWVWGLLRPLSIRGVTTRHTI